MRRSPHGLCGLACCALALVATAAPAATPDPFRLVPDQANAFLRIEKPRDAVQSVLEFEPFRELLELHAARQLYDLTSVRRFFQLVGYFEKQLGQPWPELLDRLAGGGIVLASKVGEDKAPVLLVVQARDEALLARFTKLARELGDQELARQESRQHIRTTSYKGVETMQIGNDLSAAVAGSALLVGNRTEVLHRALDLHLAPGKGKSLADVPAVAEARKLLPPDPLQWMWLDLAPVHHSPQAKEVFARPRNDINLTVGVGGWLDVAGRSPFLCAGSYRRPDGFLTTIRMPRGREGMAPEMALHIPPTADAGALPLLEPKGVLYSTSIYLDFAKFWDARKELFNEQQVKALENADKQAAPFLLGNRLSKLLTEAGPHVRFVLVHEPRAYKGPPGGPAALEIPLGYAIAVDMRKPSFGKSVEAILRSLLLLAGTQTKVKMVEEKRGDVMIVSYHQPDPAARRRPNNPLAAFESPSFARVGDHFVAATSVEIAREVVDAVRDEAAHPAKRKPTRAAVLNRFYSEAGIDVMRAFQDQLFTITVLNQGLSPSEARDEVERLIHAARSLGVLETKGVYGAHDFRYELRLRTAPAKGSALKGE